MEEAKKWLVTGSPEISTIGKWAISLKLKNSKTMDAYYAVTEKWGNKLYNTCNEEREKGKRFEAAFIFDNNFSDILYFAMEEQQREVVCDSFIFDLHSLCNLYQRLYE